MLQYGFLKLCSAVSIYKAPSWKLKYTDSWEPSESVSHSQCADGLGAREAASPALSKFPYSVIDIATNI